MLCIALDKMVKLLSQRPASYIIVESCPKPHFAEQAKVDEVHQLTFKKEVARRRLASSLDLLLDEHAEQQQKATKECSNLQSEWQRVGPADA